VYTRDIGESCCVVRFTGISPENLDLQASSYMASLRNGNALVSISLGGNFPEKEMTSSMDHFLAEMDAQTQSYAE